jgi:hypothetical protein
MNRKLQVLKNNQLHNQALKSRTLHKSTENHTNTLFSTDEKATIRNVKNITTLQTQKMGRYTSIGSRICNKLTETNHQNYMRHFVGKGIMKKNCPGNYTETKK